MEEKKKSSHVSRCNAPALYPASFSVNQTKNDHYRKVEASGASGLSITNLLHLIGYLPDFSMVWGCVQDACDLAKYNFHKPQLVGKVLGSQWSKPCPAITILEVLFTLAYIKAQSKTPRHACKMSFTKPTYPNTIYIFKPCSGDTPSI